MTGGYPLRGAMLALALFATPALGADADTADRDAIDAAYAAFSRGDAAEVVAQSEKVIARFETNADRNAVYACASGFGDTLTALVGAAAAEAEGKGSGRDTVAISSDICDAYFMKGFALVDLKRSDEARPFLEQAVAMDPDNDHYINELAEWHKVARDWATSLNLFTRASTTTDRALSMMDDRASADRIAKERKCRAFRGIAFNHSEMRNWDKARAAIAECQKLIPDDEKSLVELAYIKEQSGE